MKLSDAIMLGSTTVKLDPTSWLLHTEEAECGCLLGMGMSGDGYEEDSDEEGVITKYPWLTTLLQPPTLPRLNLNLIGILPHTHFTVPSALIPVFIAIEHKATVRGIDIISYMAFSVAQKTMTLEQAVDWIRSVEPQGDEDENQSIAYEDPDRQGQSAEAIGPQKEASTGASR